MDDLGGSSSPYNEKLFDDATCGHTTPREPHDLSHQGLRPPSPRGHAKPIGNVGAAGCLRRYATGGGMPKSLYQLSGYKLVPLGLPVHWREFLSGCHPSGVQQTHCFRWLTIQVSNVGRIFRRVGSVISLNEISNLSYCWHSPPDACCACRATPPDVPPSTQVRRLCCDRFPPGPSVESNPVKWPCYFPAHRASRLQHRFPEPLAIPAWIYFLQAQNEQSRRRLKRLSPGPAYLQPTEIDEPQ